MGNKLEILQLLENGSITAEEAERLLDTAEHEGVGSLPSGDARTDGCHTECGRGCPVRRG